MKIKAGPFLRLKLAHMGCKPRRASNSYFEPRRLVYPVIPAGKQESSHTDVKPESVIDDQSIAYATEPLPSMVLDSCIPAGIRALLPK